MRVAVDHLLAGVGILGTGMAKRAVAAFLGVVEVRPVYARVAWRNAASLGFWPVVGFGRWDGSGGLRMGAGSMWRGLSLS